MFDPDDDYELPAIDGWDLVVNAIEDPDDYLIETHCVDDFDDFGEIPYIE